MTKNGAMHIASLRDGRRIFIGGSLVENHVEHRAFRESILSAAKLYEYQSRPENLERMTFSSPGTGDRVSRMWQLPKCYEELVERRHALTEWAQLSFGFMGRSPDHVASALSGMYMGLSLFRQHGERFAHALSGYYEYARDHDLYLTYAIVNPPFDRSKSTGEQVEEFAAAGVVDQDAEGIVVRGAKMLATASPMANEVMIAAIQPLKPGEEKYSFTAMVPFGEPRLRVLSRKSYETAAVTRFDNPLSSCFDENDSVLYLDDVKIPWDRVFVFNDVQMAAAQWFSIPTHCYQNYQCQVRLAVKLHFLLGIARKIAEVNGIIGFPSVKETLGQLAAEVSMVEGLVESMEVSGAHFEGYFVPNGARLYAANVLTQQIYPRFVHALRELSGGGMIMLPSCAADLENPEAVEFIRKTQLSPAVDYLERIKLFKLAWDAVGSEFGSRHLQYEMFYSGANMVTRGHCFRTFDWNRGVSLVDSLLSSYSVSETGQTAPPAQCAV
jgi:4-hydroxyphenylacetate 3-monooxygenase